MACILSGRGEHRREIFVRVRSPKVAGKCLEKMAQTSHGGPFSPSPATKTPSSSFTLEKNIYPNMVIPKKASIIPLVLALIVATSYARNSRRDFLRAHNRARDDVGVGPMRWDPDLAKYAQDHGNKLKVSCRIVPSAGPYSENLARNRGDLTASRAVNMWVSEKPNYDYESNSCKGGPCLQYTQVVWKKSIWLGCAKVRCDNGLGTIIICIYNPKGNIKGNVLMMFQFQVPSSFENDDGINICCYCGLMK
ncbi:pathogenesis-related protein 1-like [Prosopis cineraria]|uniref:pathogenesis-related protein 1-like n=1 Tax=Prosopis cineraria TaxID=364024 RepID=UPI00240F452D|nr:pathogenesis-related protein 1-like [Prosopis cineraria]